MASPCRRCRANQECEAWRGHGAQDASPGIGNDGRSEEPGVRGKIGFSTAHSSSSPSLGTEVRSEEGGARSETSFSPPYSFLPTPVFFPAGRFTRLGASEQRPQAA